MNTISLKILASLIALFGLGAGSGYVVAKRTSPAPPAPLARVAAMPLGIRTNLPNRFFTRWSDRRIAEYRQLLNLTSSQEAGLRTHFEALAADYDSLRADIRARMTQALVRANTDIARDLTPEQRQLFWQHLREKAKKAEE